MAFTVVRENFLYFRIKLYPVLVAGSFHYSPTSERLDGPFQKFVGLQTDNEFVFLVNITGFMGCNGRDSLGIDGAYTVVLSFFLHSLQAFVPQFSGPVRRAAEERCITCIRRDVPVYKI